MTNTRNLLKWLIQAVTVAQLLITAAIASATESDSVLGYLTDKDGNYAGPTVEDNIIAMDTDKNGFADVFEVCAFLQLKHGKNYQKDLLDRWEASANGKSCSTPFAKALYSDETY